ncbi:MAG: serine protease [Verrucomicrobiota bacterium]
MGPPSHNPLFLPLRALLAALVIAAAARAESRIWTDTQGRTLQAELLEKRGENIVVKRDDGLVFTLPLDRLINSDREYATAWKPKLLQVPPVETAVLLINTPDGRGSGFLAQDNGRAYAYTNQHVIAGTPLDQIVITSSDGRRHVAEAIEVMPDADLARLRVNATAGLIIGDPARLEDPVAVYGNSQGAGVTTLSRGKVLGVSADQLEVSSEIVPGNSGGPVLNQAGEVVGISTYLALLDPSAQAGRDGDDDWTLKNTRYNKPRRFALRVIRGMDWREQSPAVYVAQSRKVRDLELLVREGWTLAERLVTEPTRGVPGSLSNDDRLREVVTQQNDLEKKLSRTVLSSFNSLDDMERFNVSMNQAYRRRLAMIGEILEREVSEGRRDPPRLELPYHIDNYETAAKQAAHLAEELDRIKERSVPFMTLR